MTLIRVRILLALSAAVLLPLLAGAIYLAVRFPAPAIPALLGAVLGGRRSVRQTPEGLTPLDRRAWLQVYGASTRMAILFGALGYAALGALGVGVPSPEAPLFWRLFGGLVFGALAGVIAGWAVALVAELLLNTRWVRQFRGAKRAA